VTAEDAAAYSAPPATVAAHWAALVGDYLAVFARGERPTRLFATTGRARALLDLQAEVGFRAGTGVTAGRMAGELRDADGMVKAVTVEMRLSGGRLAGTMSVGRKVTMKVPLQDVAVDGGTLRFNVRRGGTVHAFEGPVAAGEVSGPIFDGSPKGQAVGRLTLKYARPLS
jgi:hypothetical protein